jgi:hypothetical protein
MLAADEAMQQCAVLLDPVDHQLDGIKLSRPAGGVVRG